MNKKISIIVSFYNEEESIESFITETTKELNKIQELDYEIIFINDCSTDKSSALLLGKILASSSASTTLGM